MKMRLQFPSLPATLVSVGLLVATGCGSRDENASPSGRPAVRVETVVVRAHEVPVTTEAVGSVQPWARVSPGTKLMGRIDRLTVREGDRVSKDQLLAVLEKRDLEAAVDQSRAALAAADASLDNARAQHRRMTDLHGRGSVTAKSLEDAISGYRVAEAQRGQAQAALAAAEVTLGYAEILSPISGWVTARNAEQGDMASPGMALLTIEDTSRVKIRVLLAAADAAGLASGHPARVQIDGLESNREAAVDRVLPAADPRSHTFQVELVLANPLEDLKSGMFARVLLDRGSREAVLVPAEALVARGQLRGVFTVDESAKVHLRWVRLGAARAGQVEVISGLAVGVRIVNSPPPGLADGSPVEVR